MADSRSGNGIEYALIQVSSTAAELVNPMIFMTDRTVDPRFSRTSAVRPDSSPSPIQRNHLDSDVGVTVDASTLP